MNSENTGILLGKLDAFIKKYYLSQIIKGFILTLALLGLIYLGLSIAEYFGRFSTPTRTVLFFGGIVSFILIFIIMILIPVLKLFRIGNVISYSQASKILGSYFPEIADKLQNTLELSELTETESETKDLILASIKQRTLQLSPIPFLNAIKLRKNLNYLKFLLPVTIIIAAVFTFWPFVITEGTERIINYSVYYETPAPFRFELQNDSLSVKRGDNFKIFVKTTGKYIPEQVILNYRGNGFYMEQESPGIFSYNFKNLNNNIEFFFSSQDIRSMEYKINVLPAPIIIDFSINITPPAYTKIERSIVKNTGDISVPVGSRVEWSFNTANLKTLEAIFDTTTIIAEKNITGVGFSRTIMNPGTYRLISANEFFKEQTGINYHINVIPDMFPSIVVQTIIDSVDKTVYYFNGVIDDDYGFTSLTFNYRPGEKSDTIISVNIPFSRNMQAQSFFFAFDFSAIEIQGRQVSYYFEVGDNDAVHGSKKSKTSTEDFVIPSIREMEAESEKVMQSIESDIADAKKLADEVRKDIESLQKKLMDNQLTEWERTQNIQQLINKQKQIESLMQNVSEEQKSLNDLKDQFAKNEELMKKYQQIQDLLDNLIDDEMRDLIQQLQELAKDFDMSKFQDLMEDMKQNAGDINAEMDKALELLKRMEVEERVNNAVTKLEELAEKHDKLSEETKNKESDLSEVKTEQDDHKKEFEEIKEEYEKTLEKNKDLKKPYQLDDFSKEFEQVLDNFKKSKDQLDKNDKKGASESQQNSAQQMKQMSEQMQAMMDSQMQQQNYENMQHLRQILDNLLIFSFEQEEIMINQKDVSARDPRYREFMIRQKRIQDNYSIIRDSLNALGSRVPELSTVITKEQNEIYRNLNGILDNMADNRQFQVQSAQQLVMTSANNLALMLSEVLEQMQNQMAMSMGGEGGDCNNCQGQGEGEMGRMRDIQQGLKQQLQDLLEQMQSNGKSPGQAPGEQLAKMLKQQEIMQKMLNDMMSGGINPDAARILNEINRMIEENISDIINRNITPEIISRQEMILTRLLQAEKSERERELDEKRESNEAREYKISNPDKAFDNWEKEIRFNELLRISNIKLNTYYQNRYKEYLKELGGE